MNRQCTGRSRCTRATNTLRRTIALKFIPFYPTDSLQAGTITYNGIPYHDVAMLYDIVRDEVAVRPPEGGYRVQVRSSKVSDFSLGSQRFVRLDSTSGLPAGFYQQLYKGGVVVLAHRQKIIHEDISGGTYKADYLPKDRFYIRKEGEYHEVKSKGSTLSLFPDQSKVLRKYLRANKLKFNDNQREQALVKLVQQYEALIR